MFEKPTLQFVLRRNRIPVSSHFLLLVAFTALVNTCHQWLNPFRDSRRLFPSLLTALFLVSLSFAQLPAVPEIPNESLLVGEILDVAEIDSRELDIRPQQILCRFMVQIRSVQDVPGMANLLRGAEGKIVEAYRMEMPCSEPAGKAVKARLTFHGDERNGRFWIVGSFQVTGF
jgi:hypothetical protein